MQIGFITIFISFVQSSVVFKMNLELPYNLKKSFILIDMLIYLKYMSYLTDSYTTFTLKMESVSKNTIFDLKMMVKSGLEKINFKIPPCRKIVTFITY